MEGVDTVDGKSKGTIEEAVVVVAAVDLAADVVAVDAAKAPECFNIFTVGVELEYGVNEAAIEEADEEVVVVVKIGADIVV